ncbi:MAG: hypothetical protein P4L82_07535 [Ancalomicrobiaceae bacterium]|nr:hypothetical protein [Ancalomicrobiaceae bacterium]
MWAFCLVSFVVGMGLAALFPVRQFAIGMVLIAIGGLVQAHYFGAPFGETLLIAAALFACGQFGYVAGFGVRALLVWRARVRRPPSGAEPAGLDKSLPGSPARGRH